jgi:hypothetical protein
LFGDDGKSHGLFVVNYINMSIVSEISCMRGGATLSRVERGDEKEYRRYHSMLSRKRKAIKEKFRKDVEIELLKFLDDPGVSREELREKYNTLVEQAKQDIRDVK